MTFRFDPHRALATIRNGNPAKAAISATVAKSASLSSDLACSAQGCDTATAATVGDVPPSLGIRTVATAARRATALQQKNPAETLAFGPTVAEIATLAGVRASYAERPDFGAWCERAEAEERAAVEQGYTDAPTLHSALIASWDEGLARLAAADLCRSGAEHVANAQAFIRDAWAAKALALGWTEAELLWADEREPWRRYDRLGAAYFADDVRSLTADAIVCGVRDGPPHSLRRARGDGRGALPWLRDVD